MDSKRTELHLTGCEESREENDNSNNNLLDGRVSWFVCMCVVLANAILVGCVYIYGIFLPLLLDEFQEGKTRTAVVASLSIGCSTLLCPISSKICLRFGSRVTIVAAGLINSLGLLASSFAPNLYILYLTYGTLLGFAASMVYMAGFQTVPLYFDKHRFLATGILGVGCASGVLLMSCIVQQLLDHLDWRKTFMVLAGTNLVSCLLGCTITRKTTSLKRCNDQHSKPRSTRKLLFNCIHSLDFSLFKDPLFMDLSLTSSVTTIGIWSPYFHLAKYAAEIGIPGEQSTWMYFTIGTASMVLRILTGRLIDICKVPPVRFYQVAITVLGIANFLVPLTTKYSVLMVYSLVFGMCDGVFGSTIICVMSKTYAGMGFGWCLSFHGVALLISPIFGGLISDVSGSYHPVFYAAGGILLLSVCLIQTTQWIKTKTKEQHKLLEREELVIVERETVC